MSELITFPLPDGANYVIPDIGDENWGQNVTDFLVALPAGVLPRSGNYAFTGDVTITGGFSFTLPYLKTSTINPATAGFLRLAKTEAIEWRNNANSANLPLAINGSDQLTFNGAVVTSGGITALTGDATATGPGSVPLTLATVNGNVGSFTNAHITVNGKGLITAASSGTTGNLTDVGTDGITITGGTGAVLGSGTTISQHVADSTHNGYLSSTDWSTFNSAAGGGITSLTGDVTGTGPGATATTLATVNSNVGSFTSANITVNAKGLITAASNGSASGTVNSGTATEVAYYATSTNAVSSSGNLIITGGTTNLLSVINTNGSGSSGLSLEGNSITQTRIIFNTGGSLIHELISSSGVFKLQDVTNSNTDVLVYTNSARSVAIHGTNTNDDAPAGFVGEFFTANATDTLAPTTNQWGDLASFTLTAGDWDVSGFASANTNQAGAVTELDLGISTTAGNSSTGLTNGLTFAQMGGTVCSSNTLTLSVPLVRMSLSSSTTVYLKYFATYSGSNPHYYGSIKARRRR